MSEAIAANLNGIDYPLGQVDTKISSRGDHGGSSEKGVGSATGVHMDRPEHEKHKHDREGQLQNVGAMDGPRFIMVLHEQNGGTSVDIWNRAVTRRAAWNSNDSRRVHADINGPKSIYVLNGPCRCASLQENNATKFYHRGSGSGGPCFTLIVTLSCAVDEALAKLVMIEGAKCLSAIEKLFVEYTR